MRLDLKLECYQIREADSLLLYRSVTEQAKFKKGFHIYHADLGRWHPESFIEPGFDRLFRNTGIIPPGNYLIHLSLSDDSLQINRHFIFTKDSALALNSTLRNRVNDILSRNGAVRFRTQPQGGPVLLPGVTASARLRKILGVTTRPVVRNGKDCLEFYYADWYLGWYQLASQRELRERIEQERRVLRLHPVVLASDDLESSDQLSAQIQRLSLKTEDRREWTGTLDLLNVAGTATDPASAQDARYTELRADAHTEVGSIPVGLEVFYTTQDRHREAKAGYFRLQYDVTKTRAQLLGLLEDYHLRYQQATSRAAGLNGVYHDYLNGLIARKSQLAREISILSAEADQLSAAAHSSSAIPDGRSVIADAAINTSEGKVQSRKDSLTSELQRREQMLAETEVRMEHYRQLLQQYETRLRLDSGLVYSRAAKVKDYSRASNRELAKAASGLLPMGRADRLIYSLTHLELGILNRYESDYTLAGQTLKGGSVGMDLGPVQTGLTLGNTEYVTREGYLEQYHALLFSNQFKPVYGQHLGLIYCNYSPSRQVLDKDQFFKDGVSFPSFVRPVHVLSITHSGEVTSYVTLQSELAASYREGSGEPMLKSDHMALKFSVVGRLPRWPVELQAETEQVGRSFENAALPLNKAATQRYTVGGRADILRSLLTVGVQYNYLQLGTFSTTAYSTRWGFDLKTNSRRYPNLLISYKPFATFRTYNDTFTVPRRPLTGEVWTSKLSWQFKRQERSHRFSVVYNQNISHTADTQRYSSRTLQAGYLYADAANSFAANAGWTQLPASDIGQPLSNWFIHGSINRILGRRISIVAAQNLALHRRGLQRLATTGGLSYRLLKQPMTFRVQCRYTRVNALPGLQAQDMFLGETGFNWRFQTGTSPIKSEHR